MKKLLLTILTCFLLIGCAPVAEDKKGDDALEADRTDYFQLLKDFQTREKNNANNNDDPQFDAFLDRVFRETFEDDYVGMHFTMLDYEAYGIEKGEVNWGEIAYDDNGELSEQMEDWLAALKEFDYSSLSARQQYDYEALEYSIYETLAMVPYQKYELLFDSQGEIAAAIVSNLQNFTFYDEESIQDYLLLLKDVDRYLDDCITYTNAQRKDGICMSEYSIDSCLEYLDSVLEKRDDNILITSFEDRLNRSSVTENKKKEYKKENKETVLNEVLPAFEKLEEEISSYYDDKKTSEDCALFNYDKDYAELLYILQGSNNLSVDEIYQAVLDEMDLLIANFNTGLYDKESYEEMVALNDGEILDDCLSLSSDEKLNVLLDYIREDYPEVEGLTWTCEVDEAANSSTAAYYYSAPIDNFNQNIIMTNADNTGDVYDDYSTIAHEGIPGHMYQHIYFLKTSPHPFHSTIGFIGYTEGWAVKGQMDAMRYLKGLTSEYAHYYLDYLYMSYFYLYTAIDIMVNYYGKSLKEVAELLEDYDYNAGAAQILYDVVVDMPGVYASYGLGVTYFNGLTRMAQEALSENFNYKEYNEVLLKNGPLPFPILKGAVEEYIASK